MWSEFLVKFFEPFSQACPQDLTSIVGTPLASMYKFLRILQAQCRTPYSNSKNFKPNRLLYSLKESSPVELFLEQNLFHILNKMILTMGKNQCWAPQVFF